MQTIALINALAEEAIHDRDAHEALVHRYGGKLGHCQPVYLDSYPQILEAVASGRCDYGIVLMRHSERGVLAETAAFWLEQGKTGANRLTVVAEDIVSYSPQAVLRFHLVKANTHFASERDKDKTSMIIRLTEKTGGTDKIIGLLDFIRAEEVFIHTIHEGKWGASTFYLEFVSRHISSCALNSLLTLRTELAHVFGRYPCWKA